MPLPMGLAFVFVFSFALLAWGGGGEVGGGLGGEWVGVIVFSGWGGMGVLSQS